jgi:hypothetical protein
MRQKPSLPRCAWASMAASAARPALSWKGRGLFFHTTRRSLPYCVRSWRIVSSTRVQKGHWKSEKITSVARASLRPSTGLLPTGIRSASAIAAPPPPFALASAVTAPPGSAGALAPVMLPTTKPNTSAMMMEIAAAPLLTLHSVMLVDLRGGARRRRPRVGPVCTGASRVRRRESRSRGGCVHRPAHAPR